MLVFRLRSIGFWSGGDFFGFFFFNIDVKVSWGEGWGLGVVLFILFIRVILYLVLFLLVGIVWCCFLRRGFLILRLWMGF